jgi:hypothetical protein
MRRIRNHLNARGAERGRPIRLAVRVNESLHSRFLAGVGTLSASPLQIGFVGFHFRKSGRAPQQSPQPGFIVVVHFHRIGVGVAY